jgi:hypothetical protein
MLSLTRRAPAAPDRRRRPAAVVIGVSVVVLLAAGLTAAQATSSTTNVAITPLSPVKTVAAAKSIPASGTFAFLAAGGTSTVPSDAHVVQLGITVKGSQAGTLSFYPLGDPGSASPTTVAWSAGGTGAGTVNVNVGMSDKVVIANNSSAAATVGIKITGYSTQITAAGISGSGGTAGQVLTNTGSGAAWQSHGQAYSSYPGFFVVGISATAPTTIVSVPVPAGTYYVSGVGTFQASGGGRASAQCALKAPNGAIMQNTIGVADSTTINDTALSLSGVTTTGGGTIRVDCQSFAGSSTAGNMSLVALKLDSATGSVTASATQPGSSGTSSVPVK